MKKRIYSIDELPYYLNAADISALLGLGLTAAYEMLHDVRCPKIVHGKRIIVPRDKFLAYLDQRIEDSLKGEERELDKKKR